MTSPSATSLSSKIRRCCVDRLRSPSESCRESGRLPSAGSCHKRSFGTNAPGSFGQARLPKPLNQLLHIVDRLTRPILADIVKAGSTSSRRAAASRASASRPRWAKADARQRYQGSDRPTLPLRSTRSAQSTPCRLHQRLQLCSTAQDPEGPRALRIYL